MLDQGWQREKARQSEQERKAKKGGKRGAVIRLRYTHYQPTRPHRSTEIKALKEAHATEVRALKKEHRTALKEPLFEERRKHQDKQQVVGPLKEALEKAKKKAAGAQVEVSDLTVQVNQEKALRVELEGRLAQGHSLAETLKTQLDAQKGDDSTVAGTVSFHGSEGQFDPVPVTVPIRPIHSDARLSLLGFFSIGTVPSPEEHFAVTPYLGVLAGSL